MGIELRKLTEHDPALGEALDVMRAAFVGMQGRIDPPSSLGDLTVERLSQTASEAEVWVATTKGRATEFGLIVGTVILTPKDTVLCVGKLAGRDRRTGFGRALMALAEDRAQALGFGWLELESRVELVEVHAVFKALEFREIGRTTHAGYVRLTSILFRKRVG